ncbi:MAG: hypothetical protein WCP28_19750 [Actinomycetes bacterium]
MTTRSKAAAPPPSSPDDDKPATPAETRAELLSRSKRDVTPVRKSFVQNPPGAAERPGPLSTFVSRRDLRALQAYLLLIAINSSDQVDGWSATLPIGTWARAFDLTKDATAASASTAASKILRRLQVSVARLKSPVVAN